jgi:pyruvate kinase
MIKTKIVATVGPASSTPAMLRHFIDEGVDVVRLNMSHGSHEDHQRALDALRGVVTDLGSHTAIMADLCGPKVRTGAIDPQQAEIIPGATCTIVRHAAQGTAARFATNYPELIDDVEIGHRILIDDGRICLRAVDKDSGALICTCEVGGMLGTRKGVNVPDSDLSLSSLTEKDRADLDWAITNELDYVALSFVRNAEGVRLLRAAVDQAGSDMPIVAKIETPQAIAALASIIEAADAILVARGDLGVEMDVWRIPMLQKDMVDRCRRAGKPVIIATQMLHSMVHQPTPTRAEVSDVANAVLDGADAVMLSAESAVGRYPIEAIAMMNRICRQAQDYRFKAGEDRIEPFEPGLRVGYELDRTTFAVARSAVLVAHDLGAKLIAVWCRSGRTVRWISKYQASQPILGLSDNSAVCRRLTLCYGVEAMAVPPQFAEHGPPWAELERRIVEACSLTAGDVVVVVGDPSVPQRAATLSIHVVGALQTP